MSAQRGPTDEDVLDSFNYHQPSPAQIEKISRVRQACKAAARIILAEVAPSADRTFALRHLHEAMMNANKSIVLEKAPVSPPA